MSTSLLKLNRTLTSAALLALPILVGWTGMANATGRDDQWYIGFGGTASWLAPDPEQPGNNTDEFFSGGGTLMIGRDLDERASIQLQGFSLGDATLDDGSTVDFNAVDASVVYRFFDTRDNNLNNSVFGTSLYGRFALGYATRDSDTELEREDEVYFGAGGGFETYLHQNVAVRGEGFFHDIDAVSASLSLVFRFGGARRGVPGLLPPSTTASTRPDSPQTQEIPNESVTDESITADSPTTPTIPVQPPVASSVTDIDADGVPNELDNCPDSNRGFPVRDDGCPLFDGVLSGIKFIEGTADLTSGSTEQLDFLVDMLVNNYPSARIELHAHTDNEGDVRSQAILTRGRLRTVGMYLVERGVSANRLALRSFGGSRPLFDNATEEGRASNNRFEILERPR